MTQIRARMEARVRMKIKTRRLRDTPVTATILDTMELTVKYVGTSKSRIAVNRALWASLWLQIGNFVLKQQNLKP